MRKYTVKSGDTLSKIANRYGVTIAEIMNLNDIEDENLIYAGQIINIPNYSILFGSLDPWGMAIGNSKESLDEIQEKGSQFIDEIQEKGSHFIDKTIAWLKVGKNSIIAIIGLYFAFKLGLFNKFSFIRKITRFKRAKRRNYKY